MTFDHWDSRDLKGLVGQTIRQIHVNDARDVITFTTLEGRQQYAAEGDCCSKSWIEHMDMDAVPQVIGTPVLRVVVDDGRVDDAAHDRDCEAKDKPRTAERDYDSPAPHCWCECVRVYQYVIQTARGGLALEMRNSSNGYYGGSLERVE